MTTPYTYCITHKPSGRRYYGSKIAEGCHPSTFWIDYFTSSKVVRRLIEQDGKDAFSFEIRKTFEDKGSCISWEKRVLRRLKVDKNDAWLNLSVGGHYDPDKATDYMLAIHGARHALSLKKFKDKFNDTCLLRYGHVEYLGSEDSTIKRIKTYIDKYGVDHPKRHPPNVQKCIDLLLEKHGVINVFQLDSVKSKSKETLEEKYGVSNISQLDACKQKKSETCLENYGVDNPMKSEEIRDSAKQTMLEKYGVDNISKSPQHREMINKAISASWVNRPIKVCPHCGKSSVNAAGMSRWHFDNCKKKTA